MEFPKGITGSNPVPSASSMKYYEDGFESRRQACRDGVARFFSRKILVTKSCTLRK
jgi:hypothetical protein